MPYLMVLASICLLWFIFYMVLYTVQRVQRNMKRTRRLQRSIDRIARARY